MTSAVSSASASGESQMPFAEKIARDPIGVYNDLKMRRRDAGICFSFPEIDEVISQLAAHVNKPAPTPIVFEGWRKTRVKFIAESARLKNRGYPYRETLNYINFFLECLNFCYLDARSNQGQITNNRLNHRVIPITDWTLCSGMVEQNPDLFIFPVLEELPISFFLATQSVRIYPFKISLPKNSEDERSGFTHTLDHTLAAERAFLRHTGEFDDEKCARFQKNYLTIKASFAESETKELREACDLILYKLFHEWGCIKADPALLEVKLLEVQDRSFDKVTRLSPFINQAKERLLQLVAARILEHSPPKIPVNSVIFLDIDGVLFNLKNGHLLTPKIRELFPFEVIHSPFDALRLEAMAHLFSKDPVFHLESLLRKMQNLHIVISSAWRLGKRVSELKDILKIHQFARFIIDKTPDSVGVEQVGKRAREIDHWLTKHPQITHFVILDDIDDGLSEAFPDHFVHLPNNTLLTEEHARKAEEILCHN